MVILIKKQPISCAFYLATIVGLVLKKLPFQLVLLVKFTLYLMGTSTTAPEDAAGPSSVSSLFPPPLLPIAQAVAAIFKKPDPLSSSPLTSGPPGALAPPTDK